MIIDSQITIGEFIDKEFTQDEIKNEPMLFSCDVNSALRIGGPLTHAFLEVLTDQWLDNPSTIIDSRVHMLMEGWYPCIPGYHHDDVPRSKNGQPDYLNPEYRSEHVLMLINADVAPTEFALGSGDFELPPTGEVIYKHWHNAVINKIGEKKLKVVSAPDRTLVYFDDRTWHQGVAAIKSGWRFFIRASRNTNRKHLNEERKQVQVYLQNPMAGW